MCSCINIPQRIHKLPKWSINNHGNGLMAYCEPDCNGTLWKPDIVKAGHYSFSRNMHLHKKVNEDTKMEYKIQSIGPNQNEPYFKKNCAKRLVLYLEGLENVSNNRTEIVNVLSNQTFEVMLQQHKKDFENLANKFVILERKFNILEVKWQQSESKLDDCQRKVNVTLEKYKEEIEDLRKHVKKDLIDLFA